MENIATFLLFLFMHLLFVSSSSKHTTTRPSNEFFTSGEDMTILYNVERKLSKQFLKYIKEEEKRLEGLENEIRNIEKILPPKDYVDDDEQWVSHITNAHGILKRMSMFWPQLDKYSKENTSKNAMIRVKEDLTKLKYAYPADEDLSGALAAIFRLQDTYDITPAEFIEGLSPCSHKLSIEEIFEMGFLCIGIKDFYHARLWLKEAFYRFPLGVTQVGFLDKASLLG